MTSNLGAVFFKEHSLMLPLTIRPLEDLEFNKFLSARTELYEFARKQDLFRLVDANYIEYKTALNEYFKTHCETSDMAGSHLEGVIFNINRLVLNLLSAVRTFLDHAETNLKRTYGEKSDNFQTFNKACSSCFDNYFSYRFLYKLRNYSQHIGMPITCLDASSEMVNLNPLKFDHMLKTVAMKNDLLKYDKWGKYKEFEIKDEINLLPEKIDIDPYIDEMMYCIEKINVTLCGKDEFIELLQHTAFLDKLVKEASIKGGIPCVFRQMQKFSNADELGLHFSEKFNFRIYQFPLSEMELIDSLNIRSNRSPLE